MISTEKIMHDAVAANNGAWIRAIYLHVGTTAHDHRVKGKIFAEALNRFESDRSTQIAARAMRAKRDFYSHHHADRFYCFDCSALDGTPHDWTDEDWCSYAAAEETLNEKRIKGG